MRWQDLYVLQARELYTSPTSLSLWLKDVTSNSRLGGCTRKNSRNVRPRGTLPISVSRNRPEYISAYAGRTKNVRT